MVHRSGVDPDPITHDLRVARSAADAFTAYTDGIGAWWPPDLTADASTLETVIIEPADDGRVFERHRDGRECDWGRVTEWQPAERMAYTSTLAQPGEHASLITVTFTDIDDGCAVHVEHGGWNDLNGVYRDKFSALWPEILAAFASYAGARR
jgi:hypothetical protein